MRIRGCINLMRIYFLSQMYDFFSYLRLYKTLHCADEPKFLPDRSPPEASRMNPSARPLPLRPTSLHRWPVRLSQGGLLYDVLRPSALWISCC